MSSKILIIEDDQKIAATVKLYLEGEGYEVVVVDNGHEALREARKRSPVLIILDLMLPGINGLDVCRPLRAESDVYILMLTARTTEQDKLRGLNLGADDYITKPFSPRELVARVRAVLRRQRPEPMQTEISVGPLTINLQRHDVSLHGEPLVVAACAF